MGACQEAVSTLDVEPGLALNAFGCSVNAADANRVTGRAEFIHGILEVADGAGRLAAGRRAVQEKPGCAGRTGSCPWAEAGCTGWIAFSTLLR